MKKANITETGIYEDLRPELHEDALKRIKEVYFEETGEISFLKKDE